MILGFQITTTGLICLCLVLFVDSLLDGQGSRLVVDLIAGAAWVCSIAMFIGALMIVWSL